MEKDILTFSGNHTHGMLPGLHPFSAYSFYVRVYNGRGEGPESLTHDFKTPEGGKTMKHSSLTIQAKYGIYKPFAGNNIFICKNM